MLALQSPPHEDGFGTRALPRSPVGYEEPMMAQGDLVGVRSARGRGGSRTNLNALLEL